MQQKKWKNNEKLRIVLEGLSGNIIIAELCNKYGIHQSQYYKWRELLLSQGEKVFDTQKINKQESSLLAENQKLTNIIGQLTVELKKTELELL